MAKYEVTINDKKYEVEIVRDDGHRAVLKVNGREYEVEAQSVSAGSVPVPSPSLKTSPPADTTPNPPKPLAAATAAPSAPKSAAEPGDLQVRAPMPGVVLEVVVSVGQRIKPGDLLLCIEAMKMENNIKSHTEGTVKEILVTKGDEVAEGDVLIVLEG